MFAICLNCSKNIRTANGWAFHSSWCKPSAPVAENRPRPELHGPVSYATCAAVHPRGHVECNRPVDHAGPHQTVDYYGEKRMPAVRNSWEQAPETVAERAAAFVAEHPMHDLATVADTMTRADATIAAQDAERAELAAAYGAETLRALALATIAEQAPDVAPDVAPEHQDIGASWTCADCNGRTYELPIVSHSVYHGTRAERARDLEAMQKGTYHAPAPKVRKAPAVKVAKVSGIVRDGRDVLVGPVRVSFLDFDDLPAEGARQAREMLAHGGRGLATRRTFGRLDIGNAADPLATAAAPVSGWRAPVSGYPVIAYGPGDDRGAGADRSYSSSNYSCSYPRLEAMHASAEERKATRRTHSRPAWRSVADPLASAQRPPVAGQIAGIGRPVGHALAVGLRERTAILARASFADGGTRELAA